MEGATCSTKVAQLMLIARRSLWTVLKYRASVDVTLPGSCRVVETDGNQSLLMICVEGTNVWRLKFREDVHEFCVKAQELGAMAPL